MHRRFLVLFFLLLFLAPFRAHAQSAGDACSTAKQIVRVEGNQGPGLICNGSTLEVYESVNTGPLRKGIGLTSPASALDVNGGVRIGADSAACAAAKEGTIRYVAASDSYEFCNGSAWLPFETVGTSCADDATGQCVLSATRSSGDPDFTAANVKCGKNILNVTGTFSMVPSISGLVGYWKFNEATGSTTAADSSSGGNTGTLTNMDPNTDWVAGKLGNALDFDGSNDSVLNAATNGMTGLATVTLSAWIYPRGWGGADLGRIIQQDSGGGPQYWVLLLNGPAGSPNPRSLRFFADWDPTDGSWYTPSDSITLNAWHHVAAVYDGSSSANDPLLYIDGVLQTLTEASSPNSARGPAQSNVYIGNSAAGSRPFNGQLDDVRIYNRALDAAEIAALHEWREGCQ